MKSAPRHPRNRRHLPRLQLALQLSLLVIAAVGCYEFDNPYDPDSSSYRGYPKEREDDPAPLNAVNYDGNGASGGTPPTDTTSYLTGENVTVAVPPSSLRGPLIRDGITQRFLEWNTLASGGGSAYLPGDVFIWSGTETTLYAQWTSDPAVEGKIGPAGGYVFYDYGLIHVDGWRYLEAAPADAGQSSWSTTIPIGGSGTVTTVGSGLENSALLLPVLSAAGQSGQAIQVAEVYSLNGYNDWFLPSQEALQYVYSALYAPGIGTLQAAVYWSSSELDTDYVRSWNFISDFATNGQKTIGSYRVLPVRRFRQLIHHQNIKR